MYIKLFAKEYPLQLFIIGKNERKYPKILAKGN